MSLELSPEATADFAQPQTEIEAPQDLTEPQNGVRGNGKYLVTWGKEADLTDLDDFHIITARGPEDALDAYGFLVGIKDDDFLNYVYGMEPENDFVGSFVDVTDDYVEDESQSEEQRMEAYAKRKVTVNSSQLESKVREFFGQVEASWADIYLPYIAEREIGPPLLTTVFEGQRPAEPFPETMLMFIWINCDYGLSAVAVDLLALDQIHVGYEDDPTPLQNRKQRERRARKKGR